MQATIGDLANRIGGQVRGNSSLVVRSTATVDRASAGAVTFVNNKPAWERFLESSAEAAVVSGIGVPECDRTLIVVVDAERAFAEIVRFFRPPVTAGAAGISPHAIIHITARIGAGTAVEAGSSIGAGVVLGNNCRVYPGVRIMDNCVIGDGSTLFPNVVVYENVRIGRRALIHAGAVLGAYGFGYRNRDGVHQLCPQLGSVLIGDDVEIGANTTIDRGTFDDTTVGDGTKMDDQVMIGHNCRIGRHNLLCSQVGIAGSTTTGDYVVMAGQVGVGDHLEIGDRVTLCAKSGVMKSIPAGETHLGAPSLPMRKQMQVMALTMKLPELKQQLRDLESEVRRLHQLRDAGELPNRAA